MFYDLRFLSFLYREEVALKILVNTLEEKFYTTEPKYDIALLLANIGGQLGLFTGFSVLTGVEILELLTDLGQTVILRLKANIWRGAQVDGAPGVLA